MASELRTYIYGVIGVTALLAIIFFVVYGENSLAIAIGIGQRAPLLLTGSADFSRIGGGFSANVIISLWAFLIALIAGFMLGSGLISTNRITRVSCGIVRNILRNSPWLVVLYAMLYLLPFEVKLFGEYYLLSPMIKAIVGLSVPVSAYVAEVFRTGVEAVPTGQWESARALGYSRMQILRYVVLPQSVPFMIPNLMSTYAGLFIGTSLVIVTGTQDVLFISRTVIASDGDEYATGIYIGVLFLFFIFAFPIASFTRWLERRSLAYK